MRFFDSIEDLVKRVSDCSVYVAIEQSKFVNFGVIRSVQRFIGLLVVFFF